MKRQQFLRHLRIHEIDIFEGKKHTRLFNVKTGQYSAISREREFGPKPIKVICSQLNIPLPK